MKICKSCYREDQKVIARGLCNSCYLWHRSNGTLDNPPPYNPPGRGSGAGRKHSPIGTRRINQEGYVLVKTKRQPGVKRRGWELEHRVVMEKLIGRELFPEENVHHKNRVRDDNRPGNLELWYESQPKGARISDLIEYILDFHLDAVLDSLEERKRHGIND